MASDLHQRPPFRAEHVGSLLRPKSLLDARAAVDEGKGSQEDLKKEEDKAIDDIVALQLKNGYHAITDGEFRRHMFWGTFFHGLEGFEEIQNPDIEIFRTYLPDIAAFVESNYKPGESVLCTGKIKHVGSTYVDQWEYLKSKVPAEEVKHCKITLAAPNWYHLRYREGVAYPKSVYANDAQYFADIAKAYQEELRIYLDALKKGCQMIDIDYVPLQTDQDLDGPLTRN